VLNVYCVNIVKEPQIQFVHNVACPKRTKLGRFVFHCGLTKIYIFLYNIASAVQFIHHRGGGNTTTKKNYRDVWAHTSSIDIRYDTLTDDLRPRGLYLIL
jgi:hypothetical protein